MIRFGAGLAMSLLVSMQGAAQPVGQWAVQQRQDPMTDVRSVEVATSATEVSGTTGTALLSFACVGRDAVVGVSWPEPVRSMPGLDLVGFTPAAVSYRFAPAPAVQERWALTDARNVTVSRRPGAFFSEAAKSGSVFVQAMSVAGREMTARFDLARLGEAIAPARPGCDWRPEP